MTIEKNMQTDIVGAFAGVANDKTLLIATIKIHM